MVSEVANGNDAWPDAGCIYVFVCVSRFSYLLLYCLLAIRVLICSVLVLQLSTDVHQCYGGCFFAQIGCDRCDRSRWSDYMDAGVLVGKSNAFQDDVKGMHTA